MRTYRTVYEYILKSLFLTVLPAVVILMLHEPLLAQESERTRTEQMLSSILRSAPTGIGVVENRVFVEVNDYILDLTGYTREEMIGQSARMLYPTQEDSDYVGREKYRQIAERGTGSVETRWMRKDGSIRHVILSSTPLDPYDLSVGVTFTVLDITDRKNAETALVTRTRWFVLGLAAFIVVLLALIAKLAVSLRQRRVAVADLRASKEYLSATLRSIGDGVIACDREGRVTSLNHAAEILTGWTSAEASGHPVEEVFCIINAQTRKTAVNPVAQTLEAGVRVELANHTALIARDGIEYQIADSCAPIHDTSGAVIGAVLVFRDVTEQYRRREELESFFTVNLDLLCIADLDGNFIKTNEAWSHILGYSTDELNGMAFLEFVHPDDMQATLDAMSHLGRGDDVMNFTNRYRCKDGSYRDIEWRSHPKGNLIYAAARDITERKRAEQELRQSKQMLELVINNIPQFVFWKDKNFVFQGCNKNFAVAAGVNSPRDIIGKTDYDLVWKKEEADSFRECDARVLSTGVCEYHIIEPLLQSDGKQAWFDTNKVPLFDEEGNVGGILGTFEDITERKKAEEERSKSLSLLDATMDSLEEGILVIDLEGKVTKHNRAFMDLWKIPPDVGSSSDEKLLQYIVPQLADPEAFLAKVKLFYESPEESLFDEILFSDGRVFERYSQPQWQDGHVVGRVWCFRDITERKRAEEALEKRLVALTQPLDSAEGIGFQDLFNPAEIQQLQDEFAQATGVASIITHPDGAPITTPSNFCRLCNDIIRKTEKGMANCCKSDAVLGQPNPRGATVQPCLSGGLWDAGAAISVGDRHVANWLIGQVRDEEQTEEKMRAYAREIGANEDAVVEAFNEVPAMSRERFEKIARALFTLAKQISTSAYQNVQQARFITERQQAEAALRASEERFRHLVENAPFGLSLMYPDQRFAFFNPQFTRIFGYTLDDIPNKNTWFLCAYPDPEYRKQVMDIWTEDLERTSHQDEMAPKEFTVRCKDGRDRRIHFRAVNLSDGSQIISYEDFTDRKQAEEERRKLQAQLAQAQKMESVGRLAGGVAHDFNNMLGVILGHAEMAMEQIPFDQPIHADLAEIQKAAQRSADLTHQLLAFARKQTVAPKVLDLNETVPGMLKMLRRLIGEDIDLAWNPGDALWPVKVDPAQVDQILANLCVNARDAINGVGKITIETENVIFDQDYCMRHAGFKPGDYVLLAVSDNGCGMDNETLSHLFEPFFTTKEMGKGTGLGLASTYGAVKQNNGFINVYSEPGHGTRFTIYLPRHTAGAAQETEERKPQVETGGGETILLVEDEPAILTMAAMMLERLGYTVIAAPSPDEAIRLAGEYSGRIDLLMTDVVMPGMNGRELAKRLLSIHPNIRRLFMSGYTANVIAHHGVLDKDVHFIQKPFSLKDLGEKLRKALEG